MPMVRAGFVSANQFTASTELAVDWEINTARIPVGSTLTRTWIDVRFNQRDVGTEPPEFRNSTGPHIWGLCFFDDASDDPGVNAEDDSIDWLWREMVVWGPPTLSPNTLTGDPQWVRAAGGTPGLRDSKGMRTMRQAPAFMHWCHNLPTVFGDTPIGLYYEIFVHTLWLVH